MLIIRSPLRITLGGGGTDLPSYYREHEGFLVSAAIDKYVYLTIMRPFEPGIYLKYSLQEHVKHPMEIKHPIVREVLQLEDVMTHQIEIASMADIPAGTGLGSSGSFTTALIKGLYAYHRKLISPQELAELACSIEIDHLKESVGKQDQYIAAYGGVTCFTFHKNDHVTIEPLRLSMETLFDLEDHLLLFFTGFSRSAGTILKDQDKRSQKNDPDMLSNLHYVKQLGYKSRSALESGDVAQFVELMNEHWEYKRRRSGGMTSPQIDEWYALAMQNGALGGKIVGAGGGGFLMFYAADRAKLRQAMAKAGLEEVRFRFDFEGTKVVLS